MQSKKKQPKRSKTVYRAIPPTVPAFPQQQQPARHPQPGEVAQAAVTAAALRQLNQYAQDIEAFLQASKMRTLLNRLQAEVAPPTMAEQTHMRLHREPTT
jgi:hypothetical protein